MASKKTVIITLTIILTVFIGAIVIMSLTNHIAQNPPGTFGNTAGNLNNGGYFCEAGDTVYFANPYDHGTIYSMTADEQNIKKLNKSSAMYICSGGNYLYYFQKNDSAASDLGFIIHNAGIYRCKKNGNDVFCLDRASSQNINLIDNTIFYEKAVPGAQTLQLASIGTDKEDPQIALDHLVNPSCVYDGVIYYPNTTQNFYLYGYDTRTGNNELILDYALWYPVLNDGKIYFLDIHNNYRLCSYDLSTKDLIALTNDRVDAFNLSEYYIYYQKNDETAPALMRMQKDGLNPEVIAEGNYSDINVTSQYVYFHAFGSEMPIYQLPVNGSAQFSVFDGAKQAVVVK